MVAVHVSKVSKDYSPHGYTINADLKVEFHDGGGAPASIMHLPLLPQDADLILESITILDFNGIVGDPANHWTIGFGQWDPSVGPPPAPGAVTPIATWTSNTGNPAFTVDLAPATPTLVPFDGYRVLRAGTALMVAADGQGAPPAIDLLIWVRYRRKA